MINNPEVTIQEMRQSASTCRSVKLLEWLFTVLKILNDSLHCYIHVKLKIQKLGEKTILTVRQWQRTLLCPLCHSATASRKATCSCRIIVHGGTSKPPPPVMTDDSTKKSLRLNRPEFNQETPRHAGSILVSTQPLVKGCFCDIIQFGHADIKSILFQFLFK